MTPTMVFERRPDGRSHQDVIVEAVAPHGPGDVFTYDQLAEILAEGIDRTFDRPAVQQVVNQAKRQLLLEHKRTLVNVKNVGYMIAHARDHAGIASDHTKRGRRQMRKALDTMENARLEEMTPQQLALHQAQLDINRQLHHEQERIIRRQKKHGDLIAKLCQRVEQLEADRKVN